MQMEQITLLYNARITQNTTITLIAMIKQS